MSPNLHVGICIYEMVCGKAPTSILMSFHQKQGTLVLGQEGDLLAMYPTKREGDISFPQE